MEIIYIKLGTASTFKSGRLNLVLDVNNKIATPLDYLNVNDDIFKGLASGDIIQISESEYYSLDLSTSPPLVVNTNYLLTLNSFINGCPQTNDVFFLRRGNAFYATTWTNMKTCSQGGVKIKLEFEVGDTHPDYNLPNDGDTIFTDSKFIGKNFRFEINGNAIYTKVNTNKIYYQNDLLGTLTRPDTFQAGESIGIYEL